MNTLLRRRITPTYLSGFALLLCLSACKSTGSNTAPLSEDEPGHFVGVVDCDPSDRSCTSCVSNMTGAFDALAQSVEHAPPTGSQGYQFGDFVYAKTLPPYGKDTAELNRMFDHIQTVHSVRAFELATGDPWLVIDSQDQRYFTGAHETTWHRGLTFGRLDRATGAIEGRYFYPMPDTPHPDGLQIYGRYLAVGAECPSHKQHCPAFVDFYDVGEFEKYADEVCDPNDVPRCEQATGVCTGKPCGPARFMTRLYLDGTRGEPYQGPNTGRVSAVALTRLADGHYFLYVARGSTRSDGWYYLSDGTTIEPTTKFAYVGEHTARDYLNSGGSDHWEDENYQNVNFVTECETGRLHLVGLGDALDLYGLSVGRTADGASDANTWVPMLDRLRSVSKGHCARPREGAGIAPMPDETLGLNCITGVGSRRGAWQLFLEPGDS